MLFNVGQMVVCVDDKPRRNGPVEVVKGQVYTVRGFDTHPAAGLLLEEIVRPDEVYADGTETGFLRGRFRPVKETNIDVFRKFVAPTPEKETA